MKYITLKFSILLVFMGISTLLAQKSEIPLSLNDALKMAEKNNFELKLAQNDVDKVQADLNKTLSVFLPQLTLSETYIETNDPLNVFGFKLKQEIVTAADFNPALLNDPANFKNFNTKIEVKQPILNLDGFLGRAAAGQGLSAMEYKLERTKNYVKFLIKQNYYQLLVAQKTVDVMEKTLEASKKNYIQAKDYYDQGMINKSDLLMAEVMVSNLESKKLEAENNLNTTSENLKFMLGIEENGIVLPIDDLEKKNISNVDYSLENINESRTDMLAMKHRINSLNNKSYMSKFKFLPRINAFGSYEWNDDKLFGSNANNWTVGLNMQWDVFKGFSNIGEVQKNNAELETAKIEYHKASRKNKVEIESSIGNLKTSSKRVELASKSLEQAEESLKIIKDRYANGMEKTSDLLFALSKYAEAQLNQLGALFAQNMSVFNLELLLEKEL